MPIKSATRLQLAAANRGERRRAAPSYYTSVPPIGEERRQTAHTRSPSPAGGSGATYLHIAVTEASIPSCCVNACCLLRAEEAAIDAKMHRRC
ncbi:hypothetical protein PAHAL_3G162000 [Panicum hallii]|uniref:Uncharacterized protein n=1 Tax=Panicum hallii TaxID=206008 RepID=A0A2T8KIH6_9POAL|nr:hypothetical protein PAHAL_3G162000 [Panicum hallii]